MPEVTPYMSILIDISTHLFATLHEQFEAKIVKYITLTIYYLLKLSPKYVHIDRPSCFQELRVGKYINQYIMSKSFLE